jgi:hypothetical protein
MLNVVVTCVANDLSFLSLSFNFNCSSYIIKQVRQLQDNGETNRTNTYTVFWIIDDIYREREFESF